MGTWESECALLRGQKIQLIPLPQKGHYSSDWQGRQGSRLLPLQLSIKGKVPSSFCYHLTLLHWQFWDFR